MKQVQLTFIRPTSLRVSCYCLSDGSGTNTKANDEAWHQSVGVLQLIRYTKITFNRCYMIQKKCVSMLVFYQNWWRTIPEECNYTEMRQYSSHGPGKTDSLVNHVNFHGWVLLLGLGSVYAWCCVAVVDARRGWLNGSRLILFPCVK